MIKNMIKNTKKHLAMFLATAVVVTGLPVMTADAATVVYKNGDETVKTVSVNSKEEADREKVENNGCKHFTGWSYDLDWDTVSDNDTVIATAEFKTVHGESVEETTKEATCTEEGTKVVKCKECGEVLDTITVSANGHGETVTTTTEATCGKDGKIEYTCEDCGETVSDNTVIPATGKHTTKETVTEATCGKDGKIEYTCKDCGKTVSDNKVIPATGKHTWDAGKETTPATTEKEGVKTFTCTVCGATKTEPIAKLDKEEKPVEVKPTLKLNAKSITLQVKKSTTAVKASGMVKGDKVVSWTSSNKKIATVTNKGKITAKKVGTTTITVKTKLGAKASFKVKVQKKPVVLKKLSVNKKKVTLTKGKSTTLVVTKSPITAQDKVTFKTSNKKVATVSKSGKITAKKAGKATITVKAGKKSVKVTVTVKNSKKK